MPSKLELRGGRSTNARSSLPSWIGRVNALLLDSNLLVVLIVGKVASELLGKAPVKDYGRDDFELLVELVSKFETIVTTQAVLAEANALLTKTGAWAREECRAALAEQIPLFQEHHAASAELARNPAFSRFGITDVSIQAASIEGTIVLTADWPLAGFLRNSGISALHYDELLSYRESELGNAEL